MAFAHDRREITDANDFFTGRRCDAAEGDDVLKGVVYFNPLKTAWIGVGFPYFWVFRVQLVQVANQRLHAFVHRRLE